MVLIDMTTTPTTDLPIDVYKAHLQMGSGFTDDNLQDEVLESYVRAAIAAIETRIGKVLMQRQFSWALTRWSDSSAQTLPVAPVGRIISITVADASGAETIIDPEKYAFEADSHRPRIVSLTGTLPRVSAAGNLTIVFEAGFGASWDDIPADLRQAVLLLAAHYYENRSNTSGAGGIVPFGVMSLIEPYRTIRNFGARS